MENVEARAAGYYFVILNEGIRPSILSPDPALEQQGKYPFPMGFFIHPYCLKQVYKDDYREFIESYDAYLHWYTADSERRREWYDQMRKRVIQTSQIIENGNKYFVRLWQMILNTKGENGYGK